MFLIAANPGEAEVAQYTYQVLEKQSQSRSLFVQGLEIHGADLYLSAGGYGESQLLRYRLSDGQLLARTVLAPYLFAEGITVLEDSLYQLTWRAQRVLVYDPVSLKTRRLLTITGEGWGITNNGSELIYSDGSEHLHFMDPTTGDLRHRLTVTENGLPLQRLNELEWVNGQIWANVWQTDRVVIIDPHTGIVAGSLNLQGLLPDTERLLDTDVLNGIARHPDGKTLWVTGKRWPWRYRIGVKKTPAATANTDVTLESR